MLDGRKALTRVELIVVAVIAVTALAVAVPWLLGGRDRERRQTCEFRQRVLALALLGVEERKERFPGYANRTVDPELFASWVVQILPELGREDMAKRWQGGKSAAVYLPQLICPSAPPQRRALEIPHLRYVVNCGLPGEDNLAAGVFFDHRKKQGNVVATLKNIEQHDGAAHTIMLSENLQAGFWTDVEAADVGMVWHRVPQPCNEINACTDVGERPRDIKYARPSSNHPGLFVLTFCDGQVSAKNAKMDYGVFQSLMAPDDAGAGLSASQGR